VTHGLVGGTAADLQGGHFGSGFISQAIAKSLSGPVHGVFGNNVFGGSIAEAVIGGTASELTGGKFANGAVTAAFGYLYNYCGAKLDCSRVRGEEAEAVRERDLEKIQSAFEEVGEFFSDLPDLYGSADIGGTGFVGLTGFSVGSGFGVDSSGNVCGLITGCFQVGLGFYGGVGGNFSLGTTTVPLSTGSSKSVGGFFYLGNAGGSVDFSSSSVSSTKGFFGGGVGGATGVQFCRTDASCR